MKKVHFIGIAGMGMSATALLLRDAGVTVSGSDADAYPPATDELARHGIAWTPHYSPSNIPENADAIVIGKNAKLTHEQNAEVRAAYASGIPIMSFPEVLETLLKGRVPIVVAGSYGKSTVTSLLAYLLSHAEVDAGWFIGAAPAGMEQGHLGTRPIFVVEGDEYPTSHEDLQPKFAHYHAHDALITAASHDHANVYKTQEEFLVPFRGLVRGLPAEGLLMLSADEPYVRGLASESAARVATYGLAADADWRAERVTHGETTTFDLMHGNDKVITLATRLLGAHNAQNVAGAAGLLLEKGLVTPEQIAAALPSFKGLTRRLDKKTIGSRVPAYEGFGSSRDKLQAAIAAMRAHYPGKRLVVVFEPHSFSWRNRNMLHWFDDAFGGAGILILYKPAEQGADTHEQMTHEEMLARLTKAGVDVRPALTVEETLKLLRAEVREGDVVLMSSSGPMDGLIQAIPRWLDETFGA